MLTWLKKGHSTQLSGSVWSVLDVLLYPTLYFLFTPQLSSNFGLELFGVWCFANTAIVFLQVFQMGLGTSTQRAVASAYAASDYSELHRILRTRLSGALVLTGVVCILTTVASIFQYHRNFLHVAQSLLTNSALSIGVCGCVAGLKIVEQVLINTLIALGKVHIAAIYNSLVRIAVLCIALSISASSGKSIGAILTAQAIIMSLSLLFLKGKLKTQIPGYVFRFDYERAWFGKERFESRMIWYQSILVILAFQCDKLIIASLIGVREFSFYATGSTLFNHLHLAIMAVTPFALTELSKKHTLQSDVRAYYCSLRSFILLLSFVGFGVLHFIWKPLFDLWIGHSFSEGLDKYIDLYILFEWNLVFTIGAFYLLNATGRYQLAVTNTMIFTGLSAFGSVAGYFACRSGTGLLLGSCCGLSLAIPIQQYLIARSFGWKLLPEVVLPTLPFFFFGIYIFIQGQHLVAGLCALATAIICLAYFLMQYPIHFRLLFSKQHASDQRHSTR